MAEAKPDGMSDQDWTNFQSRYRSDPAQMEQQRNAATGGAGGSTPGAGTPGVPGQVAPALKNPAPSPTPTLQPSPAPSIGMGNTIDAQQPQRVQGAGLQQADPFAGMTREQYAAANPGGAMQSQDRPPTPLTDEQRAAGMAGRGSISAGPMPGKPGGDPSAAAQQQTPAQQMQSQLRTSIMGLLGQNTNAASVTDADLAPQSQAFASAEQRQQAVRRAELVHQAQRGGYGDSGGLDQRIDALSQQTGQAIGAHDADLVGQKLESRKQQLMTALGQAQQLGMADESNNLQRQLANLGASVETRGQDVSREGLQLQNNLANLDASSRIYIADLNAKMQADGYSTQERLARMDSELKRYGIDVQGRLGELDTALRGQLGNRQIDLGYDQLGVDVGKTQAQMNRDAVIGAMGG